MPAEQPPPFGRLFSQVEPLQKPVAAHPASVTQLVPQAVPAQMKGGHELVCGAGQLGPVPGQLAEIVATLAVQLAARHCVEPLRNRSAGQLALEPVQFSATSQVPADPRQTAPALPAGWSHAPDKQVSVVHGLPSSGHAVPLPLAGCWQASATPLQVSLVQAFPSSGQAAPAASLPSAQPVEIPSQRSCRSQGWPFCARHTAPALPAGCAQVPLPLHWSSVQGLLSVAHAVPAALGGCWQALATPLQVSFVQSAPSSVQAVPFARFASVHVVATPLHWSSRSHSPAAVRQTVPAVRGAQVPGGLLQAWQSVVPPAQSVAQQVESTQKLLVHWLPVPVQG